MRCWSFLLSKDCHSFSKRSFNCFSVHERGLRRRTADSSTPTHFPGNSDNGVVAATTIEVSFELCKPVLHGFSMMCSINIFVTSINIFVTRGLEWANNCIDRKCLPIIIPVEMGYSRPWQISEINCSALDVLFFHTIHPTRSRFCSMVFWPHLNLFSIVLSFVCP